MRSALSAMLLASAAVLAGGAWASAAEPGARPSAAERGALMPAPVPGAWPIHFIDNTSRGADGVKLADVNGDGLLDIACGWEEGGQVRVYLNPGPRKVKEPWPRVTVGSAPDVEDAVFCDVDGDGAADVVSCTEGSTRQVFIHWAPREASKYLDAAAWTTMPVAAGRGRQWMFCQLLAAGGQRALACGAKGPGAEIGLFMIPQDPRRPDAWSWRPLRPAGWIMSLEIIDMDGDSRPDVLYSDRKGTRQGAGWLRNPGAIEGAWEDVTIDNSLAGPGGAGTYMFLDYGDLDGDGLRDVVVAVKPATLLWCRRLDAGGRRWKPVRIPWPARAGTPKAAAVGDLDGDGRPDLVLTCEDAGGKEGVVWMGADRNAEDAAWQTRVLSGKGGAKYDLVRLLDLDGDGDLDALTCEERAYNAVLWHENPARNPG